MSLEKEPAGRFYKAQRLIECMQGMGFGRKCKSFDRWRIRSNNGVKMPDVYLLPAAPNLHASALIERSGTSSA
jgi:hypothetical protein